jgi:hypothetical protein
MKQIQPQLNSEYSPLSRYPRRQDFLACYLHQWNRGYFALRKTQAYLCEEFAVESPWQSNFAVYMTPQPAAHHQVIESLRAQAKARGLERISIYPPFRQDNSDFVLGSMSVLNVLPVATRSYPMSPFQPVKMITFEDCHEETLQPHPPVPDELLDYRDVNEDPWSRFIVVRAAPIS